MILPWSKCSKDKNTLWIWRKKCFGRGGHVNISIFAYLRCRNNNNNNHNHNNNNNKTQKNKSNGNNSNNKAQHNLTCLGCDCNAYLTSGFLSNKRQINANNLSQGLKACPHQTDFIAGCIEDKLYSLLIDRFTFTFRLEMCDAATQINIALVNELCFPKWMMALMVLVVVKFLTHQEHLRPRVKRSLTTPQEINLTNPERYHSQLSQMFANPPFFCMQKRNCKETFEGRNWCNFIHATCGKRRKRRS